MDKADNFADNKNKMKISIIIVNYKTKELAKDAIQSVFDKTEGVEYEIIVVDNDSRDGSAEYLRNKFGNKIELIEAGANHGFGAGNNIGIGRAKGKYIFLLNPDAKLLNNAIKMFYDYMELNADVGACCGNLYDGNMNPAVSCLKLSPSVHVQIYLIYLFLIYNLMGVKFLKFDKKLSGYYFNYGDKISNIGYVSGADMFLRKSVLDKTGLFDENIFMYAEDTDLSCRIKKAGFKLKSIPQARIMHLESQSIKNSQEKFRKLINGEYRFYFKTYGKSTVLIYLHYQMLDFFRMIIRLMLPRFILKKYFLGSDNFAFYKEKMAINKIEYCNIKKIYLNLGVK